MNKNYITPFLIFLILNQQVLADNAANEKSADSSEGAFTPATFKTGLDECFSTFSTAFGSDSISADEKKVVGDIIGEYHYCIMGNDDYKFAQSELDKTKTVQVGACKYYDSVDGSDQMVLYKAAEYCYETACSFSPAYVKCMVEDYSNAGDCDDLSAYIAPHTVNKNTYVDDLHNCLDQAVYYIQPYTERQFESCKSDCLKPYNEAVFNSNLSVKLTGDALSEYNSYNDCLNESSDCGRFMAISQQDSTSGNYANYFEECYDPCQKAVDTDKFSEMGDYKTCIDKCTMPDYSYKINAENGSLLTFSYTLMILALAYMMI